MSTPKTLISNPSTSKARPIAVIFAAGVTLLSTLNASATPALDLSRFQQGVESASAMSLLSEIWSGLARMLEKEGCQTNPDGKPLCPAPVRVDTPAADRPVPRALPSAVPKR